MICMACTSKHAGRWRGSEYILRGSVMSLALGASRLITSFTGRGQYFSRICGVLRTMSCSIRPTT